MSDPGTDYDAAKGVELIHLPPPVLSVPLCENDDAQCIIWRGAGIAKRPGGQYVTECPSYRTEELENMIEQRERFLGCLLGLATGDALGTTLEFRRPGTFRPIDDMVGGGPFALRPGEWTDDTSMALCLAESLVEKGGFDARDQMERYVRWYREGHMSSTGRCFDIGNTTRAALERFERTGDPIAGSTHAAASGNGSIMRLAPVPMYFAFDALAAIEHAAESSRTTHGSPEAVDGCRYLAALIVGALNGATKDEILAERYSPVPGLWSRQPLAPAIDEIAAGSFKRREPPEIEGSGYVVRSLEAALWAVHRSRDFRDGCLRAVNLGADADTTGAVYGQLAGALHGAESIPSEWRARLAKGNSIQALASRLLDGALRRAEAATP
jgi:ADP-ribosyl-[dinitrogen reductase] hydrolase